MVNDGNLFVVSAPSGAGKTSLIAELLQTMANLHVSVSHTTRKQRDGEMDGASYHFIEFEEFQQKVNNGDFLEHALVFDNYYGTSEKEVRDRLSCGQDLLLEIDWQGAQQVRRRFEELVSIFILPPSKAILRERLRQRGKDSQETIERRMHQAESEISHYGEYDYIVVNEEFTEAVAELKAIILASRLKTRRQSKALKVLLSGLLASDGRQS